MHSLSSSAIMHTLREQASRYKILVKKSQEESDRASIPEETGSENALLFTLSSVTSFLADLIGLGVDFSALQNKRHEAGQKGLLIVTLISSKLLIRPN